MKGSRQGRNEREMEEYMNCISKKRRFSGRKDG